MMGASASLSGTKVELRPMVREDLRCHARCWNHPLTLHALRQEPLTLAELERAWDTSQFCDEEDLHYMILPRAEAEAVGYLKVKGPASRDATFWLSLLLVDPSRWGHGYGADAVRTVARALFALRNWELRLHTAADNLRARRCYEACGFVLERIEPAPMGAKHDVVPKCSYVLRKDTLR